MEEGEGRKALGEERRGEERSGERGGDSEKRNYGRVGVGLLDSNQQACAAVLLDGALLT